MNDKPKPHYPSKDKPVLIGLPALLKILPVVILLITSGVIVLTLIGPLFCAFDPNSIWCGLPRLDLGPNRSVIIIASVMAIYVTFITLKMLRRRKKSVSVIELIRGKIKR